MSAWNCQLCTNTLIDAYPDCKIERTICARQNESDPYLIRGVKACFKKLANIPQKPRLLT